MTPKEILEALAKSNESLTTGIVTGITSAVTKTLTEAGLFKKADDKDLKKDEAKAPIFKGNPSDPVAIRKHLEAVKAFQLAKDIDWTDSEAVNKHLAFLEEAAKARGNDPTDEEAGITKEDSAEVRVLKRENAALKKASRQPIDAKKEDSAYDGSFVGTQIDKAAVRTGSALAAYVNGQPLKTA